MHTLLSKKVTEILWKLHIHCYIGIELYSQQLNLLSLKVVNAQCLIVSVVFIFMIFYILKIYSLDESPELDVLFK